MPVPSSDLQANGSNHEPVSVDQFYGHENTAKMCAKFITRLFCCPDIPVSPSQTTRSAVIPPLAHFVAYALHRTRLHPSVTICTLYLLARLKSRFTRAQGSNGHALFLSAFMIASKTLCDGAYTNKLWYDVGRRLFSLCELHAMEREMCARLDWHLTVTPEDLLDFEAIVGGGDDSPFVGNSTPATLSAAKQPTGPVESLRSSSPDSIFLSPKYLTAAICQSSSLQARPMTCAKPQLHIMQSPLALPEFSPQPAWPGHAQSSLDTQITRLPLTPPLPSPPDSSHMFSGRAILIHVHIHVHVSSESLATPPPSPHLMADRSHFQPGQLSSGRPCRPSRIFRELSSNLLSGPCAATFAKENGKAAAELRFRGGQHWDHEGIVTGYRVDE